jgi:hypothetical protein
LPLGSDVSPPSSASRRRFCWLSNSCGLSPSVRNANPPLPEELLIDQNPNRKLPVEKEHSNVRQPRRTPTQKKTSQQKIGSHSTKKIPSLFFFNVFESNRRIYGGP